MTDGTLQRHWFALTVKPRHEKAVARNLQVRDLEEFTPVYAGRRAWSDRSKTVELPLFPGYVFCRFSRAERFAVVTTPGVNAVIGFGDCDMPVEDSEIASLQALVASGLPLATIPYLREGDPIRIATGPLAGARGTVLRSKGAWRLVVNVELLQRSISVEIDRAMAATTGMSSLFTQASHPHEYSNGWL